METKGCLGGSTKYIQVYLIFIERTKTHRKRSFKAVLLKKRCDIYIYVKSVSTKIFCKNSSYLINIQLNECKFINLIWYILF